MKFEEINKQMGPLLNKLKASDAYREETLNDLRIHSGAYVFYERCKPMYVGIVGRHSKNNIGGRIKQHGNGGPRSAPLASLMTIEALRLGRITLAKLAECYTPQLKEQQQLVRNMEVRAVEIKCCVTLAVFEIYAAVQLQTPYNNFCTH